MRGWRLLLVLGVTAILLWAMRTGRPVSPVYSIEEPQPATPLAAGFDPSASGTLECRVTWEGPIPDVPPISIFQARVRLDGKPSLPNPNAPRIAANHGVADAVIRLVGVDPTRSRDWDLPPTEVTMALGGLGVKQGERLSAIGLVRRGTPVAFLTPEPANHSVRGRGAAFFNQMLFTPEEPVRRSLDHSGIVELSSGSGYYWLRAYLAIADTPYLGVTDESGACALASIPAGEYEVVCWKANWCVARLDRDPEWILHSDLTFEPAVVQKQRVRIVAGQKARIAFQLRESDFRPQGP